MASIIKIAPNNVYGSRVVTALDQIRQGLGTLQELNGLRDQAIAAGDSGTTMKAVFGVTSAADAQALSDRWQNLLNVALNPNDPNYGTFIYLRDLINNVVYDTGV